MRWYRLIPVVASSCVLVLQMPAAEAAPRCDPGCRKDRTAARMLKSPQGRKALGYNAKRRCCKAGWKKVVKQKTTGGTGDWDATQKRAPAPPPPKDPVARMPEADKDCKIRDKGGNGKDPEPMVYVDRGCFIRGSERGKDDERPRTWIFQDAFWIDQHEVTVEQYGRCVAEGACTPPATHSRYCNWEQKGRKRHPVNCVDWNQAVAYCAWAGKRLPWEAEWEKGARGTDGREFPWGDERPTCERAVMNDGGYNCEGDLTWSVDLTAKTLKGKSPYCARDMSGNVWEWVQDWYHTDFYKRTSEARNPRSKTRSTSRVVRGGSWLDYSPYYMRSAFRYPQVPTSRLYIGFRCAESEAGASDDAAAPADKEPELEQFY